MIFPFHTNLIKTQLLCGTPPILSPAALECGVETIASAGIARLRRKSVALTDLFIRWVEQECPGFGLALASPREAELRGSQVALRHPEGYAIVQALIARGVVADFRTPDIVRFGFAPAYLRFTDVWDAVAALRAVLLGREWERPDGSGLPRSAGIAVGWRGPPGTWLP